MSAQVLTTPRLSQRAAGRPCHCFSSTSLKTLHSAPGCCHSAGNTSSRKVGVEAATFSPGRNSMSFPGQPVTATEPLLKSHLDSKGNVYPETGAELGDWAVFSFWRQLSLCSPGRPVTQVNYANLKLAAILLPCSQLLGSQHSWL